MRCIRKLLFSGQQYFPQDWNPAELFKYLKFSQALYPTFQAEKRLKQREQKSSKQQFTKKPPEKEWWQELEDLVDEDISVGELDQEKQISQTIQTSQIRQKIQQLSSQNVEFVQNLESLLTDLNRSEETQTDTRFSIFEDLINKVNQVKNQVPVEILLKLFLTVQNLKYFSVTDQLDQIKQVFLEKIDAISSDSINSVCRVLFQLYPRDEEVVEKLTSLINKRCQEISPNKLAHVLYLYQKQNLLSYKLKQKLLLNIQENIDQLKLAACWQIFYVMDVNFLTQYQQLNQQIVEHISMHCMDDPELFDLINLIHRSADLNINIDKIIPQIIQKLEEKLNWMQQKDLLFSIIAISRFSTQNRPKFEPLLLKICEASQKKLEQFTIFEIEKALAALSLFGIRREQKIPLIGLMQQKILKNLNILNGQQLMSLARSVLWFEGGQKPASMREFSRYILPQINQLNGKNLALASWVFVKGHEFDEELFDKIQKQALERINELNVRNISTLLISFSKSKFYYPEFFSELCEKLIEQQDQITPQIISNSMYALAHMYHDQKNIIDLLIQLGKNQLDNFTTQGLCNFAWAIAVFNRLDDQELWENIQNRVFKYDLRDMTDEDLQQLYHIDMMFRSAKNPNYQLSNAPRELKKGAWMLWMQQVECDADPSKFQLDIYYILKQLNYDARIEWQVWKGIPIDIAIVKQQKMVCIEVDGPVHFCRNMISRPLGPTVVRFRMLNSLNFTVLQIKWQDWDGLLDSDQKIGYIKQRLSEVLD